MLCALAGLSQTNKFEINAENERKFSPYMVPNHGTIEALAEFKLNHRLAYWKELWYYSESFYIKRNHFQSGYELDESIICISRFEAARKLEEEAMVEIPGSKDVLILLPAKQLIYKPEQK